MRLRAVKDMNFPDELRKLADNIEQGGSPVSGLFAVVVHEDGDISRLKATAPGCNYLLASGALFMFSTELLDWCKQRQETMGEVKQ